MTKPGSRRAGRGCAVLALAVAAALGGCSKDEKTAPKPPASAALVGTPRALFLAAASAGAPQRLHEVTTDDTFVQVEFRDEDGKRVEVLVDLVQVLSREWVFLGVYSPEPNVFFPVRYVLLRVADGKLFNADAFAYAPQVKGDTLYAIGRTTDYYVARVDLTTMTIHPMSNPAYDGVVAPLVVDGAGNVRAPGAGNTCKIFFADNSPPVVDAWGAGLGALDFCGRDGRSGATLATTYGEDGHIYSVCARELPDPESPTTTHHLQYFVREVSFTATGTQFADAAPLRSVTCTGPFDIAIDCPESPIVGITSNDSLRPRKRMVPMTTGFFSLTPVTGGGITLEWTDLPLVLPATPVLSGAYAYWRVGDTIHRIALQAGASDEVVVTVTNLISWQPAGSVVVFTKYLTGTQVATYRVTAPGAAPELVSSSDMQVQDVQEL